MTMPMVRRAATSAPPASAGMRRLEVVGLPSLPWHGGGSDVGRAMRNLGQVNPRIGPGGAVTGRVEAAVPSVARARAPGVQGFLSVCRAEDLR